MPLFSEGFLHYFTSGQFCDMTLVVHKKEYKTHRILLVYNSGYFAQKLADPKYAKQRYVHFVLTDINDPTNLFPHILRYVYEGRIKITDENCVPLLSLANSLEIEDLQRRIANFLSTSINRKNAMFVLNKALEFNTEDVKNKCLLVLARNFSRIVSAEPFDLNAAGLGAHGASRSHLRSVSYTAPAPTPTIIGFASAGNSPSSPPSTPIVAQSNTLTVGSAQYARTHKRGGSNTQTPPAPSTSPTHASTMNVPPPLGLSTSPTSPSAVSPGTSASAQGSTTWSKATAPWSASIAHVDQESPFKCLPTGLMLTLLSHVGLAVMNENLVYKAVCDYIKTKGDELTEEDCTALFEMVRFPFLNYNQLQEVMKNPAVPQHLLAEALIVRLGNFEAPNMVRPNLKPSLQKRTTCGLFFEYTFDFDDRGLLYWIATQGRTQEWVNPMRYGVKLTASSTEKGVPSDVLELKPAECWTKDVPSSWFAIDLGKNRQLVVTYYSLRHGSNSRQDCLRNWVLQCSDDGVEWETIKRHVNESQLNANFATASWPVLCINPHRYFRILQTGHNSTNKNFFSLSGIEFYGDFYQTG
eukprot:Phypoly_transcript_05428.p1 GENE.Phypoly_transcript_05428~~Phypoly_transcript_05428.p1  ORF type:complete len:582 (-),score=64.01 Phypoly_transcript_05428:105-1850(-)